VSTPPSAARFEQSRERHRAERGHAFYPPAAELAAVPQLYGTEPVPTAEKTIWLHYFVRDCDWWIAEYDPATGLAFGYACLHGDAANAEWGYVELAELEALYQEGGFVPTDVPGRVRLLPRLIVERDLDWTPRPVSAARLPGRTGCA
jgi:hypothetical protein